MQIGAGAGEEATAKGDGRFAHPIFREALAEVSFAVIHDEPFFTIVYQRGEFVGEVVDATPVRLEEAHRLADHYNLIIEGMSRSGSSVVLRFIEKGNATH